MNLFECTQVSLETVMANKLRSTLTTLGVAIGSMAIILLISISLGVKEEVTGVVKGLGSNLYLVLPGRSGLTPGGGGRGGAIRGTSSINKLRLQHAEKLERESSYHIAVSPVLNSPATVGYGREVKNDTMVTGALPNFPSVRSWPVARGTFLKKADVDLSRRVAVIGKSLEEALFKSGDALGKPISIAGEKFQVIGLMESKGQLFDLDLDNQVFIPLTTAQRVFGTNTISLIFVHVPQAEEITPAMEEAKRLLSSSLGPDDFSVKSQGETLEALQSIAAILTIMLGSIAGISLIVGGIGIMNIMIVSVTERTREIGLRKAVGAQDRDILIQFLNEAILLSLLGGCFGITLSYLLAFGISKSFPTFSVSISPSAIALGLLFSIGVGTFFGVYPAFKAASLDPIEALRHE
ncbi:MAG: ABC transporter permease [Candidatus Methylomirabilales bacterium]